MDTFKGHSFGDYKKTWVNGQEMRYIQCLKCGSVMFEDEPNPYYNLACSKGYSELEAKRKELEG